MRAHQAEKKLVPANIREGSVSGHDFSRAVDAAKSTRALQAAGKLDALKGTGFSPYINPAKSTWASAPEVCFSGLLPISRSFSETCKAPTAFLSASLALILLVGCKPVGPNYTRPGYQAPAAYKETGATAVVVPPPSPAGGGWQPATPSDGMLRGNWWEIYQDRQLNQLEDRIADNNPGLRQALETYLAARDQVKAARANLFPTTGFRQTGPWPAALPITTIW
jgi:hypothetical protein